MTLDRAAAGEVEVDPAPPAGDGGRFVVVAGAAEVGADYLEAREAVGDRLEVEGPHVHRRGEARAAHGPGARSGCFAGLTLALLLAQTLRRLRIAARVALEQVDAAADHATVEEDGHIQLFSGAIDGEVLLAVVLAPGADDLQAFIAQVVELMDALIGRHFRVYDGVGDVEVVVLLGHLEAGLV